MTPITYQEARHLILLLNRIDLDNISYEAILKHTENFLKGVEYTATLVEAGLPIFRARISATQLQKVSELKQPPAEKVTDFQRCNPPQKPMFYGAGHVATACCEVGISVGDTVYVSEWRVKNRFCSQYIPDETEGRSRVADVISTFIETRFIQPIHETFSSQYKITAAIAQQLTREDYGINYPDGGGSGDFRQYGVRSIIYPSAIQPEHLECIALRPDLVEKCLELVAVRKISITSVESGEISYKQTNFADTFSDGNIDWKSKTKTWTITPDMAGQTFVIDGDSGQWIVKKEDDSIIEPSDIPT